MSSGSASAARWPPGCCGRAVLREARRPVLRIGADEALRPALPSLSAKPSANPAGAPFSSAGRVIEILGLVQERSRTWARGAHLRRHPRGAEPHPPASLNSRRLRALARRSRVSYTTFRRSFKRQTGVRPRSS
jgi:AraC-like DNA-binding protein